VLTCFKIMFYFFKYPGISYGCPTDHDAIDPITVFIFKAFLRAVNITIAKDGYSNPGLFLIFAISDQSAAPLYNCALVRPCTDKAFIPVSCRRSATSSIFLVSSSQPNLVLNGHR
jgi:hypothetical protein